MSTDKRQRQKELHRAKIEEAREAERRAVMTRRIVGIGLALLAVVGFTIAVNVLGDDDDTVPVATDDPLDTPTTPSTEPGPPPEFVYGTTACPGDDAERTINFDDAFEDCLDDDVDYQAIMETSEGTITIDLDEGATPGTVNNFVSLARYGYYDDTLLFRTDPGLAIIQGGSPSTNSPSDPGPGYSLQDEGYDFVASGGVGPYRYERGQIVMARSAQPNGASAQFFLTTGPEVSVLDSQGTYVVFGTITEGLDVLDAIMALHEDDPTSSLGGSPSRDVVVTKVTIVEA